MHRVFGRVLLCALALSVIPARADAGPFGPIHVAANRNQYSGSDCPIAILYTASINFAQHPKGFAFSYHWERSDGKKTPVTVVRPSPTERAMSVREEWRLGERGKHYDAAMTIVVNSGNTHLSQRSPAVSVTCK